MPASRGGLLFLSFLVLGQAMDFSDYSEILEEDEETEPIDYKDPCKAGCNSIELELCWTPFLILPPIQSLGELSLTFDSASLAAVEARIGSKASKFFFLFPAFLPAEEKKECGEDGAA